MQFGVDWRRSPDREDEEPILVHPIPHLTNGSEYKVLKRTNLEKTEGFDVVCFVQCEAMIDSGGDDDKVSGLHSKTNPIIRG